MKLASRSFMVAVAAGLAGSFGGLAAQQAPDTAIILTGARLGGVRYAHTAHDGMAECTACHHESRPEKPLSSPYQGCTDCHTKTATPPMTTTIRDAYHDAPAKTGICIDCHVTEAAAGRTVPLKCTECHKKEHS